MIDEPVPTMPEMVPAIRPTVRTKRKSNVSVSSLVIASEAKQSMLCSNAVMLDMLRLTLAMTTGGKLALG